MKKRCGNCHRLKSSSAFRSQRPLCSSCSALIGEFDIEKKKENYLLCSESISLLQEKISVDCSQLNREAENFLSEYLSSHWEPACVYLGRLSETATFLIAANLDISLQIPVNNYISKIRNNTSALEKLFESVVEEDIVPEHIRGQISAKARALVSEVLKLNAYSDRLNQAEYTLSNVPNYAFTMTQVIRHFGMLGQNEKVALLKTIQLKLHNEIMPIRNLSAHATFDQGFQKLQRRKVSKKKMMRVHKVVLEVLDDYAKIFN
jgi:hypothetical protein